MPGTDSDGSGFLDQTGGDGEGPERFTSGTTSQVCLETPIITDLRDNVLVGRLDDGTEITAQIAISREVNIAGNYTLSIYSGYDNTGNPLLVVVNATPGCDNSTSAPVATPTDVATVEPITFPEEGAVYAFPGNPRQTFEDGSIEVPAIRFTGIDSQSRLIFQGGVQVTDPTTGEVIVDAWDLNEFAIGEITCLVFYDRFGQRRRYGSEC